MIIAIGNDHAAYDMKNEIMSFVESLGHKCINVGTDTNDSVDYPIYAEKVCKKIINKEAELGILICGTGIGMSIAANKIKGIRAACVENDFSAMATRKHNDANVLTFGARVIGPEVAKTIVKAFIETSFEGGRHERRVSEIKELEEKGSIENC